MTTSASLQDNFLQLIDPGMDLRFLHVVIEEWKLQIIAVYGLAQSNSGAQDFNDELFGAGGQESRK